MYNCAVRQRPVRVLSISKQSVAMRKSFLIVEDHPVFREALRLALGTGLKGSRIDLASGLAEAKSVLDGGRKFDLIVLDLWLPDANGYEGLIELRRFRPKQPIVVMSAFSDPAVVHRAMLLGASGFIAKSATREQIVTAVKSVLAGEVCLPVHGAAAPASSEAEAALRARVETLTEHQLRVLDLLCKGRLNKEIAYILDVGETTVKAHVGEILRKLRVSNRTQAVIEVSRLDLQSIAAFHAR